MHLFLSRSRAEGLMSWNNRRVSRLTQPNHVLQPDSPTCAPIASCCVSTRPRRGGPRSAWARVAASGPAQPLSPDLPGLTARGSTQLPVRLNWVPESTYYVLSFPSAPWHVHFNYFRPRALWSQVFTIQIMYHQ